MQPNAIASIVQAMLASSQPTVSQMIASRGGGGGGMNIRPQGTNLDLSLPSRSQQNAPELVVPELTPPVAGGAPSDIGAPSDMQPPDPYQSGQYRQEDDPVMAAETRTTSGAGIQPDAVPLIQQSLEAQIGLWEAENPTTLRGAWNRGKNVRDAREKVAMSRANIFSYEQAQAFAAKEKEANRVGRMADDAFKQAIVATGNPEYARKVASLVMNDPDNAEKYIGRMMEISEAQRVERREDIKEAETETDRIAGLKAMGVDDTIARAFGWNTQDSMVDQLEFLSTKRIEDMEEQELRYLTERSTADTLANVDNQIRQINKTLGLVGTGTTGLLGAIFSQIPGSPAYELFGSIDTQRAATAFKALMEMREASKTGGALGNVSNREIELLYKSFAALDPEFGAELTRENLSDVLMNFERIKYMLQNEQAFAEEGISGAEMYRRSTEHVNQRIASQQRTDVNGNPADVATAYERLRENPTPENRDDFKKHFGYVPLNLEMR